MAQVLVGIPLYNKRRFISETVASALAQSHRDLEVVVLDNGSTDGSAEVVEQIHDPRLRLVRNETNLGAIGNFNRYLGMVVEGGYQFGKLLCADDLLRPTCIERQVQALTAHDAAVAAFVRHDFVTASGRTLLRGKGMPGLAGFYAAHDIASRCLALGGNIFGAEATMLFRGRALEGIPWYPPGGMEIDFITNLLRNGGVVAVPESLARIRIDRGSISSREAHTYTERFLRAFEHLVDDVQLGDLAGRATRRQRLRARYEGGVFRLLQVVGSRL